MTAVAQPVLPTAAQLEERKSLHMTRIWVWLLRLLPQPCGNCASELAMLAVEREIAGNRDYKASDRHCRRRRREDTESCIDRVRPIWKDRPREEPAP
jgi:hypothetical protein